jgi:hypothetical protein
MQQPEIISRARYAPLPKIVLKDLKDARRTQMIGLHGTRAL